MNTLTEESKIKLKEILDLNNKLNTDSEKIIEMIRHHAEEIKELYKNKNKHFSIETGDMIVLCLELLIKEGHSADDIMEKCFGRFDNKLKGLLKD